MSSCFPKMYIMHIMHIMHMWKTDKYMGQANQNKA